jgi:hypothetical protein
MLPVRTASSPTKEMVMKRYLVPALILALESPALAAPASNFSDLQFVLLIALNLLIAGLLLFCGLVIGAVFFDKWRAHKQTAFNFRAENLECARQPRSVQRPQIIPDTQKASALSR